MGGIVRGIAAQDARPSLRRSGTPYGCCCAATWRSPALERLLRNGVEGALGLGVGRAPAVLVLGRVGVLRGVAGEVAGRWVGVACGADYRVGGCGTGDVLYEQLTHAPMCGVVSSG